MNSSTNSPDIEPDAKAARVDKLREEIISRLDLLDALGDGTARYLSSQMRGAHDGGTKLIDDSKALAEIGRLRLSGDRHAVRTVAKKLAAAGGGSWESISRRLRMKEKTRSPLFSASAGQ
jgi:hypothetical protein